MKKATLILTSIVLSCCVQAQTTGTVRDRDGNTYKTIVIGDQTWMAENLKTRQWNDDLDIPLISNNPSTTAWGAFDVSAYCWYNDNIANKDRCGALYNWYAITYGGRYTTGKMLCPNTDWYVPNNTDWQILIDYLGGAALAGKELSAAYGSSGFAAVPTGYRLANAEFGGLDTRTRFWSSTMADKKNTWTYQLGVIGGVLKASVDYSAGCSVRCIKTSITTQVENTDNSNVFKIFPNPVVDKLTVEYTGEKSDLSIYNLLGCLVYEKQLNSGKSEHDVLNLSNGIYVVRIENTKGIIQQKLIKQ